MKELNLTWNDSNAGLPLSFNLNLSRYWDIKNATMGVSPLPRSWSGTLYYPSDITMDIGANGNDWAWPGPFGQATQFQGGNTSQDLAFTPDVANTLYLPLPAGAKIDSITLDVNNTGTGRYEYSMTVGNSPTTVWYMSSVDFAKGPFLPTNDSDGVPTKINSVCVNNLDFPFDNHQDILGAGTGGNIFTILHDGSSSTGFNTKSKPLVVGQGTTKADILDCSLMDYNKDGSVDAAVSSADGKIYVLSNSGVGQLIPQHTINISTSMVDSVAMGDVNNDGWGDVVGGYLNGRIYVSTYDKTKNSFNTPVTMNYAGNGSMNGLSIKDMNLDGLNDVVGADEDRHWYLVQNNGSGLNQTIQVSCGGNDLTSLAIADFNFDGWPDVISGSVDGQFYMSYNKAGSFDRGTMIRGGPGSMKDVVAADFDKNGYIEALGLNGDGWIYLVNNQYGVLQDAKKLIEVGQDQNTLAIGDLNNDGALDLVTGGNKGITVYWNTFGQKKETIGVNDKGALKTEVQKYLDNHKLVPKDYDQYGNPIVNVPLQISSTYNGQLKFDNLNVTYSYEAKVDIRSALNIYIQDFPEKADHEGFMTVPVWFLMESDGLHISDISISYDVNLGAIIDSPGVSAKFNESDLAVLKGHSNLDPGCSSSDFVYTWSVDTKPLGTGCKLSTRVLEGIGGPGLHKLRFTVEKVQTHEMTYSELDIVVLEPTPPVVILPPNENIKPGKEVSVQVVASDSDPADQQNLTYGLVIAPSGMTINSTSGMINWKPTSKDVGKHMVEFNVSDGKNETQGSFYVKVEKAGSPIAVPVCFSWPVLVTVLIVCCAFGFVLGGTEVGIYAFFSFVFLMYTRLKQEMVLDNFVRGQIYGHICENPGLHLSELKKRLVVPNGTLVYHLRTLEREGLIKSYQNGAGRVFYSSKVKVSNELIHLTKAQRWILQLIKQRPGISQKEISEETGLSDSTVNRIVHDLQERGMVRMNRAKSTSCFIIEETCIF